MIGTVISHFKILKKLGEGGMGIVYKAEDTRLKRTIALKFLPPDCLQDKARKARLLQEAQAAAAINHPNICTVYEIDENADQVFIVMEYIEGQNLKEINQSGPLEIGKAIDISLQIALGLQEIHEKGMVHRDIKSENILITKKDQVKIMDFGLVKSSGVKDKILSEESTSGTVAYMSPEQIRGEEPDNRSDIWSWGIVLYEMITGQLPFKTDKPGMSVIYSILDEEPEPAQQYRPEISPETLHILNRCLEKDPGDRYQDVKDMVIDLKRAIKEISRRAPIPAAPAVPTAEITYGISTRERMHKPSPTKGRTFGKKGLAIMAGFAVLSIVAAIFLFKPVSPAPLPPAKIVPFACSLGPERTPAFSPDGNLIAYAWSESGDENNYQIYVKMTGTLNPLRLTDGSPEERGWPAFSPDGRTIIFQQRSGDKRRIYKVPALGGTVQQVINLDHKFVGSGLDWSPDGTTIVYSFQDSIAVPYHIHALSLSNSESHQMTFPPLGTWGDDLAAISPNGKWIAFHRSITGDSNAILIIPFSGGQERQINSDNHPILGLAWSEDGSEIIFSSNRGGNNRLWRIAFEGGEPKFIPEIKDDVQGFGFSKKSHRLAYTKGGNRGYIWKGTIPEREGQVAPAYRLIMNNQSQWLGRFSPDGQKIAFTFSMTGQSNIWICDSDGSNPIQLTDFGEFQCGGSYWSPDNCYIVFDSDQYGQRDIFVMSANGGGLRRLTTDAADERLPSWSRDGRWIYFTSNRGGKYGIWKVLATGGEAAQVLNQEGWLNVESSDGKWLYSYAWGKFWKLSLENGEIQYFPLDGVQSYGWLPMEDGIYFINESARSNESYLYFQNNISKRNRKLAILQQTRISCLDISPDRKSFLISNGETSDYDIFLVENFR